MGYERKKEIGRRLMDALQNLDSADDVCLSLKRRDEMMEKLNCLEGGGSEESLSQDKQKKKLNNNNKMGKLLFLSLMKKSQRNRRFHIFGKCNK